MNTLEKLQKHLATEIRIICGYPYKNIAKYVVCTDNVTLSVQASETHYSIPRDNEGPYTHVEVWCVSAPVTEFEYSNEEPSGYVPIESVVKFIDNHGGFAD